MADPNYHIWIRTIRPDPKDALKNQLKRIALVTVYSKLEFKIVYNNVGGWTLTMPGDLPEAKLLKSLLIGTPDKPTNTGAGFGGIVVTRNGVIVFSGPVRGFVETGDYTGPLGKEIEFWGVDDNGYLNARIPMAPAPEKNGILEASTGVPLINPKESLTLRYFVAPFFQNWAYRIDGNGIDVNTSRIVRNIVWRNIGSNAPFGLNKIQNRRIPFLEIATTGDFGPTNYRARSRYAGTVLQKIQEVATYVGNGTYPGDPYEKPFRGVAFRLIQNADQDANNEKLSFQRWDPRDPDHNKGVVFSAGRGNLGGYRYSHQATEVTFAVVGGQADDNAAKRNGTSRWFDHKGSDVPYDPILKTGYSNIQRYGLWEGYIDRRDIQYQTPITNKPANDSYIDMQAEMVNAMDVYLREKGEQVNIEVTAINTPNTSWPDDYNVGDLVTVIIDDFRYQQIVRDVTVTLTKEEGEVVRPTIGTEYTGVNFRLFQKFSTIEGKIRTLDSSQ